MPSEPVMPPADAQDRELARVWMSFESVNRSLQRAGLAAEAMAVLRIMEAWRRSATLADLRSLARGLAAYQPRTPRRDLTYRSKSAETQREGQAVRYAWDVAGAYVERHLTDHAEALALARAAYRAARDQVRVNQSLVTKRTGIGRDER